jgi:hypothetical protein
VASLPCRSEPAWVSAQCLLGNTFIGGVSGRERAMGALVGFVTVWAIVLALVAHEYLRRRTFGRMAGASMLSAISFFDKQCNKDAGRS